MQVELDGRLMTSREAAHDQISERLSFPAYYGRNLDALYDLLTEYREQLEITLVNPSDLISHLGGYGTSLLKTFLDAEKENACLTVSVISEIIENNT